MPLRGKDRESKRRGAKPLSDRVADMLAKIDEAMFAIGRKAVEDRDVQRLIQVERYFRQRDKDVRNEPGVAEATSESVGRYLGAFGAGPPTA